MTFSKLLLTLAGFSRRREVRLARASRSADEHELRRALTTDEDRFREVMRVRQRRPHLHLGVSLTGVPYRLPLADLTGSFVWATAGTGSGKSRMIGNIVEQLITASERGEPVATIVFDLKGGKDSLSDLTLRTVAALASRLPADRRARLLSRVRTLRFFAGDYLPELQLLKPEPSVTPVVQAHAVAEILDHTIQANLGARQSNALGALLALAIEAGLNLLDLRWLLYSPQRIVALAERSKILEARLYVRTRFAREGAVTIDGLAARCDALTRVDAIRACLAGPGMFDFRQCFEPGLTVIDLGSPPMGAESAKEALAALVFTRLTWAAFDPERVVRGATCIFADEIQEAIRTPSTLQHLARLTSTGRSFSTGCWSIHQQSGQLSPSLQELLDQNVQMRIVGRGSAAEAKAAAEWVGHTGLVPRPRTPGDARAGHSGLMSDAEEQRHRLQELTRLERQHFLVGVRPPLFANRIVIAPDFNPPSWSAIPAAVADAVLRGAVGVPRGELLARADRIETAAAQAQEAEGSVEEGSPRSRRPRRSADLPDAVSDRPRGRRGGEVL